MAMATWVAVAVWMAVWTTIWMRTWTGLQRIFNIWNFFGLRRRGAHVNPPSSLLPLDLLTQSPHGRAHVPHRTRYLRTQSHQVFDFLPQLRDLPPLTLTRSFQTLELRRLFDQLGGHAPPPAHFVGFSCER